MTRKQKILNLFLTDYYRPFGFQLLSGVGVELGSREGKFAKTLLQNKNIRRLYCVDPFAPYEDGGDLWTQEVQNAYKEKQRRRLERYHRCHRVFLPSVEAVHDFRDGELDFIYIDGEHSYQAVEQDIRLWWPKMKDGAYFGGHDFHHTWPGVIKAVTDHCQKHNLALHVESPDWWVVKGAKTPNARTERPEAK